MSGILFFIFASCHPLKRLIVLSILTPFIKKWGCVGQKTESDKGGCGRGFETHILGQISYFTPYLIDFGAGICIFDVMESIYRSFL